MNTPTKSGYRWWDKKEHYFKEWDSNQVENRMQTPSQSRQAMRYQAQDHHFGEDRVIAQMHKDCGDKEELYNHKK